MTDIGRKADRLAVSQAPMFGGLSFDHWRGWMMVAMLDKRFDLLFAVS
ncbi:hypothetical protein [Sphingorhabdus sp.]|jgi:hypothetical protein